MMYQDLLDKALSEKKRIKKKISKLKRTKPKLIDNAIHGLHEQVFQEIDCLQCANCCKTTSPIFRDIDIERAAGHLGISPSVFLEKYLQLDEEGDYVLQSSPCAFLGEDNFCSIYEHRPRACREYPHTDRKNMHQILDLTERNSRICPGVYRILDQLP